MPGGGVQMWYPDTSEYPSAQLGYCLGALHEAGEIAGTPMPVSPNVSEIVEASGPSCHR
jgi:hypothetical protein